MTETLPIPTLGPGGEVPILEDGIYFDLDESIYHAQPRLSSSMMKVLKSNVTAAWRDSPFNLERVYKGPTDAMIFGTALHKFVLEGRAAFEGSYAKPFAKDPSWLSTSDDIKAELKNLGLKVSGTKSELIERLLEGDPSLEGRLEAHHRKAWLKENDGKIELSPESYAKVEHIGVFATEKHPYKEAFKDAVSEVSILWTVSLDNGCEVKMKSRIDSLGIRRTTDLKSYTDPYNRNPQVYADMTVASLEYFMQAETYIEARVQIPKLLEAGKVYGSHDPAWLAKVAAKPNAPFVWYFVENNAYPNVVMLTYDPKRYLVGEQTQDAILLIQCRFAKYLALYGNDMWYKVYDPRSCVFDPDRIRDYQQPDEELRSEAEQFLHTPY